MNNPTHEDFHYICKELKILENCKIKDIFKSRNFYVFKFDDKKLVISKNFCCLSDLPEFEKRDNFCEFLLKKLKNKKLITLYQHEKDKILILEFSKYKVILEFIGKGNIILCDKNDEIISVLYKREFKDRRLLPKEKYLFPPKKKINISAKCEENISKKIENLYIKSKNKIILENQLKTLKKYKEEEERSRKIANLLLNEEIRKIVDEYKKTKNKKLVKKVEDNLIYLEIDNFVFPVPLDKDIKKYITEKFNESKKFRNKYIKTKEWLGKKQEKNKTERKEKRKEWYEQFRYFYTSNNLLVIAGKDAESNEKIIKKYCKKNDLVFHAHIPGSPFGVLRSNGKKIQEDDIKEAAQFIGCYSRFWVSRLGIADVYYIYPEQVSKKISGGYLKKGSFMIYGKKNFLKVELKLGIGVTEDFEVIVGPENSIKKHSKYYIFLVPGSDEGKKLSDKIKNRLIEKAKKEDKKKIKEINPDIFLKFVPFGKGEVV